jgi:hypothetical protein
MQAGQAHRLISPPSFICFLTEVCESSNVVTSHPCHWIRVTKGTRLQSNGFHITWDRNTVSCPEHGAQAVAHSRSKSAERPLLCKSHS